MTDSDGADAGTSKERLLDAALELVMEHYGSDSINRDAYAYLTPGAIAERAGLSRALIYHHWASDEGEPFDRFLDDLTERVWASEFSPELITAAAALLPNDVIELIGGLTEFELARITGDGYPLIRATHDLTLLGVISARHGAIAVSEMRPFYELALAKAGLAMKSPLTVEHFAITMMCLTDGWLLQAKVHPDMAGSRVDWAAGAESRAVSWPVLAIAIEGIVANMTEPIAD